MAATTACITTAGWARRPGLNDRQVAETAQFETSDAYDDLEREVMRYRRGGDAAHQRRPMPSMTGSSRSWATARSSSWP